jgi:hypothetical protein
VETTPSSRELRWADFERALADWLDSNGRAAEQLDELLTGVR